jgi:hypothetical protein
VVTRAVLVPEDGEVVTMIEHVVEAEVIPLILRKQRKLKGVKRRSRK